MVKTVKQGSGTGCGGVSQVLYSWPWPIIVELRPTKQEKKNTTETKESAHSSDLILTLRADLPERPPVSRSGCAR